MAAMQVDAVPSGSEDLSLAERRTRRQDRQLPLRYRDVPPETLPSLPPPPPSPGTLLLL